MFKTVVALGLLGFSLLASEVPAAEKAATSAECTPGVSFWSLLGAVKIGYTSGYLQLGKLYAVCLPQPSTPSESIYAYSPDSGGKLSTVLKDAEGQALATYVWSAENISGLWELGDYKVLGGEQSLMPLRAGGYALEFQIEGKPFYRFPFSVEVMPSDDPYQPPGNRYFIDGPWSGYGNLFYQRNDPQSSLRFTTWVEQKAGHPQEKSSPYLVALVRARDGSVVARSEGDLRANQEWRQLDVNFQLPGDKAASPMKASTLLNEDGAYRVAFRVDGHLRGTYSFTVSGGKIQLQGRQLERTPAVDRITDYLYGGHYRSWWLPREAEVAR